MEFDTFVTITAKRGQMSMFTGRGQENVQRGRDLLHCNLVITLILGAKQNERYSKTSVIMKSTYWMA